MRLPLQIAFRQMEPSPALEARIRALAARLDRFSSHIMSCHVTVEAPHQHQRQGQLFEVRIDVKVPHGELVAHREHRQHHRHEDPYVTLRDAFRAIRRQLEDYERELRLDIKHHEPPQEGLVAEVYPAEDFGRIQSRDGRSIYFHRHSVLGGDLDHLTTGTAVRFAEELGDHGPQASTVHVESRAAPRL